IGVIKDINWESPRYAQKPIIFFINNEWGVFISLKINLSNIQESLDHIKSSFNEVFPDDPFNFFFLEDEFNNQYHADMKFGKLLNVFSILAIFIACLGLFALVTFSTMMKVKEIGIRKVFGANISSIALLLSKEYIIILSISIIVAIPATIFIGNYWLNNFANRIEMSLDIFLMPAVLLFSITIVTVGYKIYSLAKINPVKSLRAE
ncbi:MAG: FtsX-like permease family protein, partial [Cyclobacteriaceae bacterium]|nr:FtsX-like permease family protein [Cyclobacteriaceae bacterium]